METNPTGKNGKAIAGRPRNEEATAAILQAAMALVEEKGFDAMSVEGVAARAGVAKTTIYRRWPNVWAIVMEAFLAEVNRAAPIAFEGTARASLAASMHSVARTFRGKQGRAMRMLLGRGQRDEELREAIWTGWIEPRRQLSRAVVRKGIERGELRQGLDPDIVLDTLYGPLYHRLLVPYGPLNDAYIEALVDTVFVGLEVKKKR